MLAEEEGGLVKDCAREEILLDGGGCARGRQVKARSAAQQHGRGRLGERVGQEGGALRSARLRVHLMARLWRPSEEGLGARPLLIQTLERAQM